VIFQSENFVLMPLSEEKSPYIAPVFVLASFSKARDYSPLDAVKKMRTFRGDPFKKHTQNRVS
jgi:hypothetical protein